MELKSLIILISFLTIIILERVYPARKYKKINFHDFINIFVGIINSFIAFISVYILSNLLKFRMAILGFLENGSFLRIMTIILILDVWTYTWHRMNHNIKFLKTFHRVHHTDTRMNITTALRFHFVEIVLSKIIISTILIVLGINIKELILYEIILNLVVYFHHSNINLRSDIDNFLVKIIVTPKMHRIHHSVIANERNSNYSAIFSFWDRIFGSFTGESKDKEVDFGINKFKDKNWTDSLMIIILPLREVFKINTTKRS